MIGGMGELVFQTRISTILACAAADATKFSIHWRGIDVTNAVWVEGSSAQPAIDASPGSISCDLIKRILATRSRLTSEKDSNIWLLQGMFSLKFGMRTTRRNLINFFYDFLHFFILFLFPSFDFNES